tara:strand:- start:792 stop:1049 length:258 start_codon:yes stop_codon:yes gene_type:complete
MVQVDYPEATSRLLSALKIAGVREVVISEGITLSDLLEGNDMTYEQLMSDRNFFLLRKNLNYPSINKDDTIIELILKIHNAMDKG